MSNVFIYSLSIIFNLKKNIIWCKKKELNFNRLLDSGAKNLRGEGNFCSASSGRFNPPPWLKSRICPWLYIYTVYLHCTLFIVQCTCYPVHCKLYKGCGEGYCVLREGSTHATGWGQMASDDRKAWAYL